MARRKGGSVLGRVLAFLVLVIMIVMIVGAVLMFFVAPSADKVENKYKADDDNVSVLVAGNIDGGIIDINAGKMAAATALFIYGYKNDTVVDGVTETATITYSVKDGDKTITYSAIVIYFKNISDANKARDGVKDKVKEDGKIAMFRGKALVLGDKKAALKYYAVLF